jgi:hypothetical protein
MKTGVPNCAGSAITGQRQLRKICVPGLSRRSRVAVKADDLTCHGFSLQSAHEADELDEVGFRGNARVNDGGPGISAGPPAGDAARQGPARTGKVSDSGFETPAGADSRPPGTRVGLSRGRAALLQLELPDDNPGGAFGVAFVPPEPLPNPPAVLALIVEQGAAPGADVVFQFRHCSAPRRNQPGRGCQRYDARRCRSVSPLLPYIGARLQSFLAQKHYSEGGAEVRISFQLSAVSFQPPAFSFRLRLPTSGFQIPDP